MDDVTETKSRMLNNNKSLFNNSCSDGFLIDIVTFGPSNGIRDTYRLVLISVSAVTTIKLFVYTNVPLNNRNCF